MYIKAILTLLLLVGSSIAWAMWRPAPVLPSSVALRPYNIWPRDGDVVDPVLDKPLKHIVIQAPKLDQALLQFRKQSGVNLVWTESSLPVMPGEPIAIEFHDTTVGVALEQILALGAHPPPIGSRDGIIEIGSGCYVRRLYDLRELLAKRRPAHRVDESAVASEGDSVHERAMALLVLILTELNDQQRPNFRATRDDFDYWNGVLVARLPVQTHRRLARFLTSLMSAM